MQKIQRIHFDELDSTISWVKAHFQELDPDAVTCVTASIQTAGKGRFSRKWVSKKGNLHMTLFYCLDKGDPRIPNLAQLMALAVCSLFPVEIKWPNDLVTHQKKLGGILVELVDFQGKFGVLHSLGLNVNTPVSTDQDTISLAEWMGRKYDINMLIEQIVSAFFQQYEKGFSAEDYNEKLTNKGKFIKCQVGKKQVKGILLGVEADGRLQLEQEDGKILKISSGDLV